MKNTENAAKRASLTLYVVALLGWRGSFIWAIAWCTNPSSTAELSVPSIIRLSLGLIRLIILKELSSVKFWWPVEVKRRGSGVWCGEVEGYWTSGANNWQWRERWDNRSDWGCSFESVLALWLYISRFADLKSIPVNEIVKPLAEEGFPSLFLYL